MFLRTLKDCFVIFIFIFIFPLVCYGDGIFDGLKIKVGLGNRQTFFTTNLEREGLEGSGGEQDSTICVDRTKDTRRRVGVVCKTGDRKFEKGFSGHIEQEKTVISLETFPSYFGDETGFGYSIGLFRSPISTIFLDYPLVDERTDFDTIYWSVMPRIFYTLGNKNIGENGDFSFQFGFGGNLSLVEKLSLSRRETKEEFTVPPSTVLTGYGFVMEVNFLYLFLRFQEIPLTINDVEFNGVTNHRIEVSSAEVYLGISINI